MVSTTRALIQLLSDEDPQTVRLVKDELEHGDEKVLQSLIELASCSCEDIAQYARDTLLKIGHAKGEDMLILRMKTVHTLADLEEILWTLSKIFVPEISVEDCQRKVNSWARQIKLELAGAVSPYDRVPRFQRFLHYKLGLRINRSGFLLEDEHFDSQVNKTGSVLSSVVETRKGTQTTAVILSLILADRVGMKTEAKYGVVRELPNFHLNHGGKPFDPLANLSRHLMWTYDPIEGEPPKIPPPRVVTPKELLMNVLVELQGDFEHSPYLRERIAHWLNEMEAHQNQDGKYPTS